MPTSTKYSNPQSSITFQQTSSSSRQNSVESTVFDDLNTLDDDVNRLETALGIGADQTESNINYSSNRVVTDGTDPITAIGALDAAVFVNALSNTISGTNTFSNNNTFSAQQTFSHATGIKLDVIQENTGAAGVTIDGLLLKDGYSIPTLASDPASPTNGAFWYNSTDHAFRGRRNGATIPLGREVVLYDQAISGASASIASVITSAFDTYIIEGYNIVPATDGAHAYIRFSTNNGSSYDAGASDYSYAITSTETSTGTYSSGGTRIQLTGTGAGSAGVGNASDEALHFNLTLAGATDATKKTQLIGSASFIRPNGETGGSHISGCRMTAQDTDAIQFLFSSGNIASGRIRVIGVRAS